MERYAPGKAQKFVVMAIVAAWVGFIALASSWAFQSYHATVKAAEDRVATSSLVVATHAKWIYEFGGQATRRLADLVESGRAPVQVNTVQDINGALEGLQTALDKNELLLREIHHRVKNNLQSVMSLIRVHLKPGEQSQALSDRIKAMVAVHELIYQHDAFEALDAAQLVRRVTENVISAYGSGVGVDFDLAPLYVSNDRATALALLVNEVVSNSLKYAFEGQDRGRIQVRLHTEDTGDMSVLEVSDDGIGFDTAIAVKGTGTKLMKGSIRQLDGSYTLDGSDGTHFSARLKLI